ncbi:MAG: hypothetical protein EXR27_14285 [Betaproteobacteria bacterium]|nr:hypothetical protein [Betaproteobacteria bacterium]
MSRIIFRCRRWRTACPRSSSRAKDISRAAEFLFNVDRDVLKARRMLADAFLAQRDGRRPLPGREALAYPVPDHAQVQFTAPV